MDFLAMDISASGLAVQRTRLNVASSNLANVSTTRGVDGGPYRRRDVVVTAQPVRAFAAGLAQFVRRVEVSQIQADTAPARLQYDPGHPDANPEGYVAYPNVNLIEEMVDMITASRAYEAGITALGTAVTMAERALGDREIATMAIDGLGPLAIHWPRAARDAAATEPVGPVLRDFGQMLAGALTEVRAHEQTADDMAQRFASGDETVGIHELMIAAEKASISLRYAVTLKNKLIEAYRDLMNTPV